MRSTPESSESSTTDTSPAAAGPPLLRRTREEREAAEEELAPLAARSALSRGRLRAEAPDPLRTAFERDRDRILHSKAFRRLKHKTQVFINPEGDHFVTRLTHALQVTQVARALAVALGLNEPLAEAIALGHDVGHSPFGHTGEDVLAEYFTDGWHHAAQSVRIYEVLEDRNLTWEVRDGIRAHTWKIEPPPGTAEGRCVRFADRIAYLTHDALDALRAGMLAPSAFPERVRTALGLPGSHWIGELVRAVVDASAAAGEVTMRSEDAAVMDELREFMFAAVYTSPQARREQREAAAVVRELMDRHLARPELIPASYRDTGAAPQVQAADYIAGMTDRYALTAHGRLVGSAAADA